ncbi:MAG: methionyl-tRNA formyltransferase [Alphaproteobacteria bacterium]|nr:methionyl-tRNA formyltransferase [Alphaproteobacteria bacterium]
MARERLRLAMMGTPDFAVPILDALVNDGHEIACVYAQPPRPAGRGQKPRPSPMEAWARDHSLDVRTPVNLKDPAEHQAFRDLNLDVAVVAAYGLILPRPILEAPRLGCLNVHASLLPRWRGAAPIQRAILEGDEETGVTIMQMDAGLDTGPMLLTEDTPIRAEDTGRTLHDRLAEMGAWLILRALDGVSRGTLKATPQPNEGVTYAKKLDRDEAKLDWSQPASCLARLVRAFDPWPGAFFDIKGERTKVWGAEAISGTGVPGTALDDRLTIACGEGALRLTRLQRAGGKAMDARAFLRGYPISKGTSLS